MQPRDLSLQKGRSYWKSMQSNDALQKGFQVAKSSLHDALQKGFQDAKSSLLLALQKGLKGPKRGLGEQFWIQSPEKCAPHAAGQHLQPFWHWAHTCLLGFCVSWHACWLQQLSCMCSYLVRLQPSLCTPCAPVSPLPCKRVFSLPCKRCIPLQKGRHGITNTIT